MDNLKKIENFILSVWSKHLNNSSIIVNDDFFALGGDSVDALRIIGEIQVEYNLKLPENIVHIYSTPTSLSIFIHQKINSGNNDNQYHIEVDAARIHDKGPLSYAQQRLWLLASLMKNNSVYNINRAIVLEGNLNIKYLKKSIREVFREHQSLRTSIESTIDLEQQIVSDQNIKIKTVDISNKTNKNQKYLEIQMKEFKKPFDTSIAPLARLTLIKIESDKHILLACFSHIIADGWSVDIFFKDLSFIYNNLFNQSKNYKISRIRVQYIAFAKWQRNFLNMELLEQQINYWKSLLKDAPSLIQLPLSNPRPLMPTYKGEIHRIKLSQLLVKSIKEYLKETESTLFIFCLSVFHALIHHYSDSEKIVIGTPIANRHYCNVNDTFGLFVNSLPTISTFSQELRFFEVINQLKKQFFESIQNQDLPFDMMVEKLGIERHPGCNPLFQIMLILKEKNSTLALNGIKSYFLQTNNQTSKLDLTLWIEDSNTECEFAFEYSTEIFEARMIESISLHFQELIKMVIEVPQLKIKDIVFSETLNRKNFTNTNRLKNCNDKCIPELFSNQVEKTPNAVAVIHNDESYTYEKLSNKASFIANVLLKKYMIKPECVVALFLDRSFNMVASLFGILKAGAAYLPIDPTLPLERINYMLTSAKVSLVLTEKKYFDKLKDFICVIVDQEKIKEVYNHDSKKTGRKAAIQNLMSVIYTSGSTGLPKAVLTEYKSTMNRLQWGWQQFPFRDSEVCCQKTSISFVDSVVEVFSPILKGVPLVILGDSEVKDVKKFILMIAKHKVTRITLVPSYLKIMLEEKHLNKLKCLKEITVSGEFLTLELAKEFYRKMPRNIKLINLYGSSEVAGDVTYHEVCENDLTGWNIPIGKAIEGNEVYILNKYNNPLPPGVVGEICIIGKHVSRGYLNEEQGQSRFVRGPFIFDNTKQSQLYKSGDYGRYLHDGTIEYMGRIDEQIKIRGYRINLKEIELFLSNHEMVSSCKVIYLNDNTNPKQLLAFVQSKQDSLSNVSFFNEALEKNILQFLSKKIPTYMQPSRVLFVDQFPLSYNGKISNAELLNLFNFKKSQAQKSSSEISEQQKVMSEEETILLSIWKDVFGFKEIGLSSDFLKLGGNSLLAAKLISRIKSRMNFEMALYAVFDNPTFHCMSQYIYENCKRKNILNQASSKN